MEGKTQPHVTGKHWSRGDRTSLGVFSPPGLDSAPELSCSHRELPPVTATVRSPFKTFPGCEWCLWPGRGSGRGLLLVSQCCLKCEGERGTDARCSWRPPGECFLCKSCLPAELVLSPACPVMVVSYFTDTLTGTLRLTPPRGNCCIFLHCCSLHLLIPAVNFSTSGILFLLQIARGAFVGFIY